MFYFYFHIYFQIEIGRKLEYSFFAAKASYIQYYKSDYKYKKKMPRKELFVGNLSRDIQKRDIEDVFDRYGKLVRCDLKDRGTNILKCIIKTKKFRQ